MSFWDQLKSRFGRGRQERAARATLARGAPAEIAAAPPEAHALAGDQGAAPDDSDRRGADEIERLAQTGLPGGPSTEEAIAILRRARGTTREADAVARVQIAMSERPISEPVRIASADILAARGDEPAALHLLRDVMSTAGLILAADLFAASGQLPRAVSTIERVLGREIDAPGARERHKRWRASLGGAAPRTGHLDEATIVAATQVRGPFRLLREVARGGAGTVYEAEDEVLGRRVAFKVYHGRGNDRALLEREVRMAASLAGPGVIRIFDAGPTEGWIALEWIPRGSVRDLLRAGDASLLAPTLAPIARWARPLALALARVHAAGIVHADVKPANVLLRHPGEPVLGDFGIARPGGAPGEPGSPGYVSPERLAGRASDPRDDVYGFGRVLEDVLHALRANQRSPLAPDADAEAWSALASLCIGPDDRRPADASELVRALP